MYKQYFGLTDPPFSITPDPRFVYLSHRHEDALAHLKYGIGQGGGGGFVQLTGEVGTGKTTLCRCLLEQLPDNARAALILNPRLDPVELLEAICDELGLSTRGARGSQKRLVDKLNRFLLDAHAKGLTVVLIIDEAQNLSPDALEQVRLLTNLETATQKLLQIVFLGQPELRDLLRRTDLRQLAQRITARYHLGPLTARETAAYTRHRLAVGGCSNEPFTKAALRRLHRCAGGVPRVINIIAERSLLAAYAQDRRRIGAATVRHAANEVLDTHGARGGRPRLALVIPLLLTLTLAIIWWLPTSFRADPNTHHEPPPASPSSDLEATISPPPAATTTAAAANALAVEQPPTRTVADAGETSLAPRIPSSDFTHAWQTLFSVRGLGVAPAIETDRCVFKLDAARYCLEGRGTLVRLQQLGRPVLIQLPGLEPGFAVLSSQPGQLTLFAGGQDQEIQTDQLEPLWSGRYWDVWEMPGYVPALLQQGDRGPGVLWVKAAAAHCNPAFTRDVDDPYFGPSMKQWAMQFQTRAGLRADGLIGPETLQLLVRCGPRVAVAER